MQNKLDIPEWEKKTLQYYKDHCNAEDITISECREGENKHVDD